MTWLGGILLALSALTGLALASALRVSVLVRRETSDTEWDVRWRVRWLFGLVTLQSDQHPSARPPRRPRAPRSPARDGSALRLLQTPGLIARTMRLADDLRRQVHVEDLHARAVVGWDDPADTGAFYGTMAPLIQYAAWRGVDVTCLPHFNGAVLAGHLQATVRVRLLLVLGACVRYLVSRPVRRAWRRR